MIYCTECGQEMPDHSKFCPSCGTPVVKMKKSESSAKEPQPADMSGTQLNVSNLYGKTDLEKLPEGYEIDQRYTVIEKLGQGSFGAVYKVFDKVMQVEKALKVIPDAVSRDKEAMASLQKEASLMVRLNHPNIVRVYDFHHSGEIKYIDMEYVSGESLAEIKLKRKDKKFTEEEVRGYMLQVLEGLEHAHKKKIIHKDIKPQNIMLTESGQIKLMDFGIAESVHSSMSRLKNTGSSGTLVYMSPEQLRGKDVGKEADIYSLGATMYELLTGHPPFYQGDITYQIINEKPQAIPDVSEQMNRVILKCLEKEHKSRYSSCEELKKALTEKRITPPESVSEQEEKIPVKATTEKPRTKGTPQGDQSKKNKKTYLWALLIIAIIAIGGAVYYVVTGFFGKKKVADIEMVFVKGGTFQMGCTSEQSDCSDDEKPILTVTVGDFYIGKYEVTQKQWQNVMETNPSSFSDCDDCPVELVSWNDVQEFIKKLNEKTGQTFRLPTEAEWEYAARGGNKSKGYKYAGSNNIDEVAWCWDNSGKRTHPVGQKQPNELGLYDMSGSVWEWCNDLYRDYNSNRENNLQGSLSDWCVTRGGSWYCDTRFCRVVDRSPKAPGSRGIGIGFRLALTP